MAHSYAFILQITSLFLHMYPACVAWTERWHPAPYVKQFTGESKALKQEWYSATLTELVLFPMVPYLLWAVCYYAKASTSRLLDAHFCPWEGLHLYWSWLSHTSGCASASLPASKEEHAPVAETHCRDLVAR